MLNSPEQLEKVKQLIAYTSSEELTAQTRLEESRKRLGFSPYFYEDGDQLLRFMWEIGMLDETHQDFTGKVLSPENIYRLAGRLHEEAAILSALFQIPEQNPNLMVLPNKRANQLLDRINVYLFSVGLSRDPLSVIKREKEHGKPTSRHSDGFAPDGFVVDTTTWEVVSDLEATITRAKPLEYLNSPENGLQGEESDSLLDYFRHKKIIFDRAQKRYKGTFSEQARVDLVLVQDASTPLHPDWVSEPIRTPYDYTRLMDHLHDLFHFYVPPQNRVTLPTIAEAQPLMGKMAHVFNPRPGLAQQTSF